jgi:hypothetical protein
MKGSHLTWSECIDALRDMIAELNIRIVRLRSEKPAREVHRRQMPGFDWLKAYLQPRAEDLADSAGKG